MSALTPDDARRYAHQVARHRGWLVNPEESMTGTLVAGLASQASRYGHPYCPCRDVDGVAADRDVICPCVYAEADIAEHGQCYCALFLSPAKDASTVQSIPERRP